jgi:hypothetical protein
MASELIQPHRGGGTEPGQDDHGQGGRVPVAQRLDGQNGHQQRGSGGQDGGHQQDEQA